MHRSNMHNQQAYDGPVDYMAVTLYFSYYNQVCISMTNIIGKRSTRFFANTAPDFMGGWYFGSLK